MKCLEASDRIRGGLVRKNEQPAVPVLRAPFLASIAFAALACPAGAADSVYDWSLQTATDLETATSVGSVDGVTVTTTGSATGGRASDTISVDPATTTNGFAGIITSEVDANVDDESVFNSINFSFSEPVYDLSFRVIDVDGFNNGTTLFSDLMVFSSSGGVPSSAVAGAQITYTSATGRALENATTNCSGNQAQCQIVVTYDGPVTSASVSHVAADVSGSTNPTNQAIQIYDLTFNTPPNATNNVAATFVGGTTTGNALTDNDGSGLDSDPQDGAAVIVNQISHPDGTSAVGGAGTTLTLLNGASLTIAQDGSYTFNTNGAYAGLGPGASTTETFTYRIEDQEGLFDGGSTATLVVTISNTSVPSFTIDKVVDQASITSPGTLNYTITVNNDGNVTLTSPSLSDTLTQGGSPLTMTTGPSLTSGDANSNGLLDVGETWVYGATYAVTTGNINDGNDILNLAIFDTAETPSQSDTASTTTPGPTFTCAGDNFPGNAISGSSGTTTCSNTGATGEAGEPNPTGGAAESIWYTWTAPLTGTVDFNTCDTGVTDYDTTLGAYTGGAVNALTTIIENDDQPGCAANTSRISFAATSGTTYRIRVDGWEGSDGNFKLDWSMTAPSATLSKSVNKTSVSGVDTLTYSIIVSNNGTVDLTSPNLDDTVVQNGATRQSLTGISPTSGDVDSDGILDTSETWIYSVTYNVSVSDVVDGNDIINTASFTSTETPTAITDTAATTISATADFSDAPASYGGAAHIIVSGINLGGSVTADAGDYSSPTASGDVDNGVTLPGFVQTASAPVTVSVSGGGGYLQAWFDWDGDGSFGGVGEQVATAVQDGGAGDTDAVLGTITLDVTPPAAAVTTQTFARFRWSTDNTAGINGSVVDGEVEDYALTIAAANPVMTITKVGTLVKAGGNVLPEAEVGDTINYTFDIQNTGNVPLFDIDVADDDTTHSGSGPLPNPANEALLTDTGTPGDTTDVTADNGIWSQLGPGDTVRFFTSYLVTQTDIDTQ